MNTFFKVSKYILYIVPFSLVIVSTSTLFPFIVGKYVFFRVAVGLSFIFFLLGLGFGSYSGYSNGKKIFEKLKSPLVIAISGFVLVFMLASFFGVDPGFSFWANFERGEGAAQIINLYIFFILLALLFNSEEDWKRFLVISLAVAGLVILYGIAAHLGKSGYQAFESFMGDKISFVNRFYGSFGNPIYITTFLIFTIFYAFYLFLNTPSKRNKIILSVLVIFYLIFFWLSQGRGGFLGLIAAIFAFLAYLVFSSRNKKLKIGGITLILFLAVIGGALVYFNDTGFVKKIPGSRIFDFSLKNQSIQNRLWTWGSAIRGIKERPVLGWGPENFSAVFDKYFDIRHFVPGQSTETWFDRAHSVYLDYAAETGILGLLSFLLIYAVFYWQFFKIRKKWLGEHHTYKKIAIQGLFAAVPVAYLVQGLTLFDVLPIYLSIFPFLAFSNFIFNSQQERKDNKEFKKTALDPLIKKSLVIFGSAAMIVFIYFSAYLPYMKSQKLIDALGGIQGGASLQSYEKAFSSALDFYSPVGQEESVRQLGNSTFSILSSQKNLPRDISEELLDFNLKYFNPIIEDSRGGNASQNILVLGQTYHVLALGYNDVNYLDTAISYYKKGLDRSPRRPQFLYSLLEAYQAKKDYPSAIKIGDEIVKYWPADTQVKQGIEDMRKLLK